MKAWKAPWPEKMEASRPKRIPPRVLHTQAWSKTKLNSNLYFWVTWGSEDAGEWRKCWKKGWIYRLELGRIASALTSSSSIDLSVFHFDSAVLHWRWNIPRWVMKILEVADLHLAERSAWNLELIAGYSLLLIKAGQLAWVDFQVWFLPLQLLFWFENF